MKLQSIVASQAFVEHIRARLTELFENDKGGLVMSIVRRSGSCRALDMPN